MNPSEKSPAIEEMLERVFGRTSSINKNKCVFCSSDCPPESFPDELSRKEYTISGLCNKCQNEVFG